MKQRIENGKLIVYEKEEAVRYIPNTTAGYSVTYSERLVCEIDLKDLAKALKPYMDCISNSEVER